MVETVHLNGLRATARPTAVAKRAAELLEGSVAKKVERWIPAGWLNECVGQRSDTKRFFP